MSHEQYEQQTQVDSPQQTQAVQEQARMQEQGPPPY